MMLAAPIFLEMSQQGQARLRRLAGPPDRRGVPRRLPRGPGPDRAARRGDAQAAPARRQAARPVRDAGPGALRVGHDRPQQRPRPRRLPDLAGHRAASRCGWRSRRTWPTRPGTSPSPIWNQQPERAGRPRGRRSPHGAAIPEVGPVPAADRPGAAAGRPAQHALQHGRPDLLRRRACRACCSWRTTTSTAPATTTRTTRWRTSTWTTGRRAPSPSRRWPGRRRSTRRAGPTYPSEAARSGRAGARRRHEQPLPPCVATGFW